MILGKEFGEGSIKSLLVTGLTALFLSLSLQKLFHKVGKIILVAEYSYLTMASKGKYRVRWKNNAVFSLEKNVLDRIPLYRRTVLKEDCLYKPIFTKTLP